MVEELQHRVIETEQTGRLDKALAEISGMSRVQAKRLIVTGHVRHNQHLVQIPDYKVSAGDQIQWTQETIQAWHLEPEDIPLDILYEDGDLLIVNKPAFMCVHPAPGQMKGTLAHALLHHCHDSLSGIGGVHRPGIVHRIDKDTSGILVVAKNDFTHQHLAQQFAAHDIERHYIAFTKGIPRARQAQLEGFIGRHQMMRKKMCLFTHQRGKYARMEYDTLAHYPCHAAKIKCTLHTGRTHQIRVQMSAINLPLIGDPLYGGKPMDGLEFPRQALHAAHLGFIHPRKSEKMSFSSPLPEDMQRLEKELQEKTATEKTSQSGQMEA